MSVSGEGVETKIVDNILHIRAENRMLGYLNAPSPFDEEGWYCTKDIVASDEDGFLTITGRDSDVINIGGLKFMPSEVERECLNIKNVKFAKAIGVSNPITGQYLQLDIEPENEDIDRDRLSREIREMLGARLPRYMLPSKINFSTQTLSHRYKKL
jgi:acyl-coenzyme A synthetase/AMP-(fatty) acid ligase